MPIRFLSQVRPRPIAGLALVAAIGCSLPLGQAWADSEMHQSPLLDRGSPEACAGVAQGRLQRGAYQWQFDCSGVPERSAPDAPRPRRR